MADYPQLGDKFQTPIGFRLACHRAALPNQVRLLISSGGLKAQHINCNALPYQSRCSMRLVARPEDGLWVVRERVTEHSHSFTDEEKTLAVSKTADAIAKLEAELVLWPETDRALAEKRRLNQEEEDDENTASQDNSQRRSTRSKRAPSNAQSTSELYPSAKSVANEVTELSLAASERHNGILPFPSPSMAFPSARDLLIYLYASAEQHQFGLIRKVPTSTDVQLVCQYGVAAGGLYPLCKARYHITKVADDLWRILEESLGQHTHAFLDDAGRGIFPGKAVRGTVKERKRQAEPSKKRPRPSQPEVRLPPIPSLPRITHSASVPHCASSTWDPSSSASLRLPPSPSARVPLQRPKTTNPARPPANIAYLPTLSTFLTSLSPRLSCLASPLLHQAHVDSPDRLMHFLSLSDLSLDLVLRDLEYLGLFERHLLKKERKRAREEGWSLWREVAC